MSKYYDKMRSDPQRWIKQQTYRKGLNEDRLINSHKKEVRKRNAAKRREFGFVSLNLPFENSNGHHIDKINVIYIPKELHKIIWHKQSNNEQMKQINILAWNFMESSNC